MVLLALAYAGPPQHGVEIHPAERDPETGRVAAGAAFRHMVMLTGIYADSPARGKLMYAVASWTAYFACAFCKLMGTMCDTVVRYLGYSKPAEVTKGHHNGCSFQMGVNDSSRMITHEQQMARAAVERVTYEAGEYTCNQSEQMCRAGYILCHTMYL